MPASLTHKISTYIANAAHLPMTGLADEYFKLGQQHEDARDPAEAENIEAMMAAVDAIGLCRFPSEWQQARDSVGFNQDAA